MSLNNLSPVVKGEIILSQELRSFSGAAANVYLEDVTLIDAPSNCIDKQVITDINHQRGITNSVKFTLNSETCDENARYTITAHISINENDKIQCGDFMTMESYPVLTFGYPHRVLIKVLEVK